MTELTPDCIAQLQQLNEALRAEIAKREQAEEALRDSELRFRAIAQSANDAIIAADSQGKITLWNKAAQAIFGYTEEEMVGQPLTLLMPDRYKSAHQSGMERLREGGEQRLIGQTVEFQGRRKNDREFPLELSLNTWMTGGGPFFSGIMRDITDRKEAEKLLAEQDNLIRTLIDILPDYIYIKDTHNGQVINNIAHVRIVEENGRNGQENFDDFSRELAGQYYAHEQEVIRTGQPLLNQEKLVTDHEGRKHWLLTTTVPLRDEHGEITALVGVSRDITEGKQTEEERDRLFTLSLDLLAVADLKGYLKQVNPAWERMLGYSQENLLAKPFIEFIHPADREAVKVELKKLAGGQNTVSFEIRFICADGAYRWVSWNVTPLVTDGLLFGVGRDVTERRQVEEALAEQHNLLRALIDKLPDYIYVKDTQSRFLLANEGIRGHFGAATVEEIVGKMDFDFSPAELAEQYYADEQTIFQSGQPLIGHEEPFFDHVTGTTRWVLTTKVPFYDSHGQIAGLVGLNRDITKRKQVEEERAKLLEAVNQQREQLRALAKRLAEVQETERQQLARELHDQIGQNLSALGFNLDFIRTQLPTLWPTAEIIQGRLHDSLGLVEQTTERIRDVLAELRPPMLDDYGLVDALEWYADRLAERFGLTLTVQGETITPRLAPTTECVLFRIAQEALTNVAKHAQATQAKVSLEAENGTVRLVITDDGLGFESVRTNGAAKRQGWGLRMMAERAEMMGGRCWVESQPGHGTRVTVEMTRAEGYEP